MTDPMVKQFHIGHILTVITGRLLTPNGLDGLYDILNFMTADSIWTHQIPRALEACKEPMLAQFPQFDTPEFQFEIGKLILMLETPTGKEQTQNLITGWLSQMAAKYGEMHTVKRLDWTTNYQSKDPVEEAIEMAGEEKVTGVTLEPKDDFPEHL